LTLGFDGRDTSIPARGYHIARRCGYYEQAHIPIVPDGVSVRDPARDEDVGSGLSIVRLACATEAQRTVEDVEGLIFGRTHVVVRLFAGARRLFDDSDATAVTQLSGLDRDVNAKVVRPALARTQHIWFGAVRHSHRLV
jgi:hypothetical protein